MIEIEKVRNFYYSFHRCCCWFSDYWRNSDISIETKIVFYITSQYLTSNRNSRISEIRRKFSICDHWHRKIATQTKRTQILFEFLFIDEKEKNNSMTSKIVTNVINQSTKSMIEMFFASIFHECWNKQNVK